MSSTPIDIYYETFYKQNCPKNEDFIASWQGMATISHSFAAMLFPLYLFGGYCIIQKTPAQMRDIKYYLLNLHFWSSFVDILACSLITPYFYFPAIAGFPIGLFRFLGVPVEVQVYLAFAVAAVLTISMVSLFENRFTILVKKYKFSRSTKMIYYGIRILFISTYTLPLYFMAPDQEKAKLNFLSVVPCPTEEYFYSPVYFFMEDPLIITIHCFITFTLLVEESSQVLIFTVACGYFIFVRNDNLTSKNTKKLQAKFFYCTIIQVSLPFMFIVIPIATIFYLIHLNYYNQTLLNLSVLVVSVHGFVSTVVMLSIHKPYRVYIVQAICKIIGKSITITPQHKQVLSVNYF